MIKYINRDQFLLFLCLSLSLFFYFSSTSAVVLHVKGEISDFISIIKYPQKLYSDIITTREENKFLKEKLVRMNLLNSKLIKDKKQIDDLKIELDFYRENPLSMKIGKIVNDNSSYLLRSLILNLGEDDGIEKNLPVVDINGLFGKIFSVGDNASQIQTINDKNFRVSIRLGKDSNLGQFIPTHHNLGIIDGIVKTAEIAVNDTVYTSGISTIYPDSIPVARVISISKDEYDPFQKIVVQILADLDNFNHVFVIL